MIALCYILLAVVISVVAAHVISVVAAHVTKEPISSKMHLAQKKFFSAVSRYYPMWWHQRNWYNDDSRPMPYGEFESKVKEYSRELGEKGSFSQDDVLDIMIHLLDKWPGGLLGINARVFLGYARERGMLDEDMRPVTDSQYVDEDSRRRERLEQLGGAGALAAYGDAMSTRRGNRR